jgi:hypothetical protein
MGITMEGSLDRQGTAPGRDEVRSRGEPVLEELLS